VIAPLKYGFGCSGGLHFVRMSNRLTKKSFRQRLGPVGEDAVLDCPKFAFRARMPADENRQLGGVSVSTAPESTSNSQLARLSAAEIVADPVSIGSKRRKGVRIGWSCEASVRPA